MAIAFSITHFQMGHAKSERIKEYCRFTHIQRNASEPLLRYDVDSVTPGSHPNAEVPSLVNPVTGKLEAPPTSFWLISSTAENAIKEREFIFSVKDAAGVTHTQRIWHATRHGQVNRWRTILGPPYDFDIEWLSANEPTAFGQGLNPAFRWKEYGSFVCETNHNPSAGGPTQAGITGFIPSPQSLSDELTVPPSPNIWNDSSQEGQYVEGAVIPCHFADNHQAIAVGDIGHNTAADKLVCYWGARSFERLKANFRGHPFLHRLTHIHYWPRDAEAADQTDRNLVSETSDDRKIAWVYVAGGPTIQDELGFDLGWYADIKKDNELRDILTLFPAAGPLNSKQEIFRARTIHTRYLISSGIVETITPSVFPSNYVLWVHSRSSDGFCIALGCHLVPIEANIDLPNVCGMWWGDSPNRITGVPVPNHAHAAGKFLTQAIERPDRKVGWVGMHYNLYVGPLSLCLATFKANIGMLDDMVTSAVVKEMVPRNVRVGTDLADVVEPVGETPHRLLPIKARAGRSISARLR